MYGIYIYANIWGILMVNVTIYGIHGSYGYILIIMTICQPSPLSRSRESLIWLGFMLDISLQLDRFSCKTKEIPEGPIWKHNDLQILTAMEWSLLLKSWLLRMKFNLCRLPAHFWWSRSPSWSFPCLMAWVEPEEHMTSPDCHGVAAEVPAHQRDSRGWVPLCWSELRQSQQIEPCRPRVGTFYGGPPHLGAAAQRVFGQRFCIRFFVETVRCLDPHFRWLISQF